MWMTSYPEQVMTEPQLIIKRMPRANYQLLASTSGHGVQTVLGFGILQPTITSWTPALITKKALGMIWDVNSDTLQFPYKQRTSIPQLSSKQEVVQETAKVFDPLGLLQPVTVATKILTQEQW